MAQPFPYTYYLCACYDTKAASAPATPATPAHDDDERTFDPRSPRANYSLYPLEHLLYCEDCRQIRCPRCVVEETLNWFCPSCLFEVPSSVVKSDGNRCTRNCYNCPVCTSPMTVSSLENPAEPSPSGGPFVLACPYCHWSTVEIGIEFDKPTGITSQLSRIANGGKSVPTQKDRGKERDRRQELETRRFQHASEDSPSPSADVVQRGAAPTHDDLFSNLSAFYKSQLASQAPSNPFSPHEVNFNSPSSFSRIMNLYATTSSKKQKREKPSPMREAASLLEGLALHDASTDAAAIERIKREGWDITLSPEQKQQQVNPSLRFSDHLRPIATLLCTKRGKRCHSCRHILSKPESKITSTRYKIKLLALNHIPRLSIRHLTPPAATPATAFNYNGMRPGIPTNFLLHISNPLFDPVRVTLATSSTTPGNVQSRVTILCPQFEVGANTDVWDDALSTTQLTPTLRSGSVDGPGIEAGKIYDRGRNWTSVVLEIVPGFVKPLTLPELHLAPTPTSSPASTPNARPKNAKTKEGDGLQLDEDDDVLEIPIFVRIEFETDLHAEVGAMSGLADSRGATGQRERREEAFWCVVGVGRIVDI